MLSYVRLASRHIDNRSRHIRAVFVVCQVDGCSLQVSHDFKLRNLQAISKDKCQGQGWRTGYGLTWNSLGMPGRFIGTWPSPRLVVCRHASRQSFLISSLKIKVASEVDNFLTIGAA